VSGRVQMQLTIEDAQYKALSARAKIMGIRATDYARRLFDAAYAARIGFERKMAVTDAELDEQVRAAFCMSGEADAAAIAKALGVPRARVEWILAGWRTYFAGEADGVQARERPDAAQAEGAAAGASIAAAPAIERPPVTTREIEGKGMPVTPSQAAARQVPRRSTNPNARSAEEIAKIVEMRKAGAGAQEIAEATGRTKAAVYTFISHNRALFEAAS
jgi:hypothetical protein